MKNRVLGLCDEVLRLYLWESLNILMWLSKEVLVDSVVNRKTTVKILMSWCISKRP